MRRVAARAEGVAQQTHLYGMYNTCTACDPAGLSVGDCHSASHCGAGVQAVERSEYSGCGQRRHTSTSHAMQSRWYGPTPPTPAAHDTGSFLSSWAGCRKLSLCRPHSNTTSMYSISRAYGSYPKCHMCCSFDNCCPWVYPPIRRWMWAACLHSRPDHRIYLYYMMCMLRSMLPVFGCRCSSGHRFDHQEIVCARLTNCVPGHMHRTTRAVTHAQGLQQS